MIALLHYLQRKLRPELSERSTASRYLLMSDVVGVLYSFPLVVLGLSWLGFVTNWRQFRVHGAWFFVILAAVILFSRLRFFMMHTVRSGHMVGSDGDFVGVILWASLLVFGPAVIWMFMIWIAVEWFITWRRAINRDMRWSSVRSASLNAASTLIPSLISLSIYQNLGGQFQFPAWMVRAFYRRW